MHETAASPILLLLPDPKSAHRLCIVKKKNKREGDCFTHPNAVPGGLFALVGEDLSANEEVRVRCAPLFRWTRVPVE